MSSLHDPTTQRREVASRWEEGEVGEGQGEVESARQGAEEAADLRAAGRPPAHLSRRNRWEDVRSYRKLTSVRMIRKYLSELRQLSQRKLPCFLSVISRAHEFRWSRGPLASMAIL